MDIDSIRLFCLSIEHGSIAAAAREIGTSPSMASRRISALEHVTIIKPVPRFGG